MSFTESWPLDPVDWCAIWRVFANVFFERPIDHRLSSPAEMLFGRPIQTNLPSRTNPSPRSESEHLKVRREEMSEHHHGKNLPTLSPGQEVKVSSEDKSECHDSSDQKRTKIIQDHDTRRIDPTQEPKSDPHCPRSSSDICRQLWATTHTTSQTTLISCQSTPYNHHTLHRSYCAATSTNNPPTSHKMPTYIPTRLCSPVTKSCRYVGTVQCPWQIAWQLCILPLCMCCFIITSIHENMSFIISVLLHRHLHFKRALQFILFFGGVEDYHHFWISVPLVLRRML